MANITPHRGRNPRRCDVCNGNHQKVDARWILHTGHVENTGPKLYVCEEHIKYLAAIYKVEWSDT